MSKGLSFIVRAHNEEKNLSECLHSLNGLKIPFEIVVILNRCTDNSLRIAQSFDLPIRIYDYDYPISRAGFETLVTPVDHPSSMISFSNAAFSQALFPWKIKWDADFVASENLIHALNNFDYRNEPTGVRISCRLGEKINRELYLSNCLVGYERHVFWESPVFADGWQEQGLPEDAYIDSLPVNHLKSYWNKEPWFMQPDSYDAELASRYNSVVDKLGPEPVGMARASNPVCEHYYKQANNLGIDFG